MRTTLFVTLALLLVSACARAPRPGTKAQSKPRSPQTRASLKSPAPTPVSTPRLDGPGCLLSMHLAHGVIDCLFARCPVELTASLLAEGDVRLEAGNDGHPVLSVHRPTPPRVVALAPMIDRDGQWILDEGQCGAAQPDLVGQKVTALNIRRLLPQPKTR